MNLHEYQAKRQFAKFGVPIPDGDIADTPAQAREVARELGGKVVVKSQVLIGGRGKAGGIKLAADPDEAEMYAEQILGMDIKGFTVRKVLIDEQAPGIEQEIYLAVLIDRAKRLPMIMASAEGGMDIEEVAEKTFRKVEPICKGHNARDNEHCGFLAGPIGQQSLSRVQPSPELYLRVLARFQRG